MAHTRRRNCGIAGRQNRDHGRSDARYRQVGFTYCTPALHISVQRCNKGVQLEMHPPEKVVERWQARAQAAVFFMYFALADIPKIAVENPVGFMNSAYRKPDMVIHPYQFATGTDDAENYHKKTDLLMDKRIAETDADSRPPRTQPRRNIRQIPERENPLLGGYRNRQRQGKTPLKDVSGYCGGNGRAMGQFNLTNEKYISNKGTLINQEDEKHET